MADKDPSERTELASDRTALANERTLAAWWRTAMAAFALALGFAKLFGDIEPAWLIRTGATLLVLLSIMTLLTALLTYRRTEKRLETEHASTVSKRTVWTGTILLVIVAAVVVAAVWMV